jgi:hypothetical protein
MFNKDYFSRWCVKYRSGVYMQYIHSNIDRIVKEIIAKDVEAAGLMLMAANE